MSQASVGEVTQNAACTLHPGLRRRLRLCVIEPQGRTNNTDSELGLNRSDSLYSQS